MINTGKDPSLRSESSAIINLRGVSTKLNKQTVVFNFCVFQHWVQTDTRTHSSMHISVPKVITDILYEMKYTYN